MRFLVTTFAHRKFVRNIGKRSSPCCSGYFDTIKSHLIRAVSSDQVSLSIDAVRELGRVETTDIFLRVTDLEFYKYEGQFYFRSDVFERIETIGYIIKTIGPPM